MADMYHQVHIQAPPEKVYDALTTQDGLRSWWTADSLFDARRGGSAQFGFAKRAVVFRMQIDVLETGKRTAWTCVGDIDDWKDTQLTWDIDKAGNGSVLHFTQSGWKAVTGHFPTANSTWGMLMYRLKDYLEGKNPGPYWKE